DTCGSAPGTGCGARAAARWCPSCARSRRSTRSSRSRACSATPSGASAIYILGLSTMTESAACLMRDGVVLAAAEEERFSRVKHDGGFPYAAIAYTLGSQGLSLGDVDHVAVYWNPYDLGYRARWLISMLLSNPQLFLEKARRATQVWSGASGQDSGW